MFDTKKDTSVEFIEAKGLLSRSDCVWKEGEYEAAMTTLLEECEMKKKEVGNVFGTILDAHFRVAAEICGMTHQDRRSVPVRIREGVHMARSMAADCSDSNVRRLCWILYTSCLVAYKNNFGKDLSWHSEKRVMEELGVCYSDEENRSKMKGCVAMWSSKILNNYRCNVKESMSTNKSCAYAGVYSNMPEGWDKKQGNVKPKQNKPDTLFWIATKMRDFADTTQFLYDVDEKTEKKKHVLRWHWVNIQLAVCDRYGEKGCRTVLQILNQLFATVSVNLTTSSKG
jgi:hypothetical protein